MAKYELFDNLKKKAFKICADINGDLGKFIENVSYIQDQLFKDTTSQSLLIVVNATNDSDQLKTPIS